MLSNGRHRAHTRSGAAGDSSMMAFSSLFADDVELGKKDDDHKPSQTAPWLFWKTPLRWRKRRILLTAGLLFILWLVFPRSSGDPIATELDPAPIPQDLPSARVPRYGQPDTRLQEPKGPPPVLKPSERDGGESKFYYDGKIKYYRLAATLHSASSTMGYRTTNRNIVFAASSLKSVSTMISMACEMAKWSKNYVHVVIMGRDDVPIDDILEVNGVDTKTCAAFWHDARPDFAEYSSDVRAEASVMSALGHVNSFIHPQVVITDDLEVEDEFFARGVREKTQEIDVPLIEVPKDASDKFTWITRLDAGSLKAWRRPSIDILIQAPAQSSGSLVRLLKSLSAADYSSLKPPRLIIDLPAEIDHVTREYVQNMVWPPVKTDDPPKSQQPSTNQLILHHRIASKRLTPEEASIRFLESFYPTKSEESHVLVISANAQLSPLYYQYLMYNLLEYRPSLWGGYDTPELMGLSLELPSKHLNGTEGFQAPKVGDMVYSDKPTENGVSSVPFLWEAPNSNAALYFGPKWLEMHSFLTYRLAAANDEPKKPADIISHTMPAWTQYALEFMRARGYHLLYPGSTSGESLVTLHNELVHLPEEYPPPKPVDNEPEKSESVPDVPDDGILQADAPRSGSSSSPKYEPSIIQSSKPLHDILPFAAELVPLRQLPRLSYDGAVTTARTASKDRKAFAARFRREIGGCEDEPAGFQRKIRSGSARDLFCFGDESEADYEEAPIGDEDGEGYHVADQSRSSSYHPGHPWDSPSKLTDEDGDKKVFAGRPLVHPSDLDISPPTLTTASEAIETSTATTAPTSAS